MTSTLQDRKLQIIERLVVVEDERVIQLIESLLFEETEVSDDEPLTEEEKSTVAQRVAAYHAEPNDEIPWETLQKDLKNRHELRP